MRRKNSPMAQETSNDVPWGFYLFGLHPSHRLPSPLIIVIPLSFCLVGWWCCHSLIVLQLQEITSQAVAHGGA
jgi:hypothetical protein